MRALSLVQNTEMQVEVQEAQSLEIELFLFRFSHSSAVILRGHEQHGMISNEAGE